MIKRLLAASLIALSVATAPALAEAADDDVALRLRATVEIDPAQIEAFEAAWLVIRDQLEADGYPYYSVVSEHQNKRVLVSVVDEYANIISAHRFVEQYRTSEDADIRAAAETMAGAIRSLHVMTTSYDKKLSYVPPNSYAGPFHELKDLHYRISDQAAKEGLLRRTRALWAEAELPQAFHVSWHGFGTDFAAVTIMTSATDLETHRANFGAVDAALEPEENQALREAFQAIVTTDKTETWMARIDLRVFPPALRAD